MEILTLSKRYSDQIIIIILFLLSFFSFVYYFEAGKILLYGDANARLNIARGVIDSLKPGFGQLSNVWLPLPTFLMLPFIWNNYLWHSGIAGSIVSMAAYIIGGIFLFKSARIISNNFLASFFAMLLYALNINILYFQTTAMSEQIFITALIIAEYCFLLWIRNEKKILPLMYAGLAITAAALIRYEGWAVMIASILMVALYLWLKTKNYHKTEGNTILYSTVAVFGFIIWTIYITVLYGDPLFWKHVYLETETRRTYTGVVSGYTYNLNVLQASWKYFTAIIWMNGLIPTVIAIAAIPIMIFKSIKSKTFYFLPMLLLLSIFVFMVLTLQRNTTLIEPDLTVKNILASGTLSVHEFNIRYGITMLPLIALLSTYIFSIRFILLRLLLVSLLTVQIYSYFNPFYSVIYQLPIGNNSEMIIAGSTRRDDFVNWFKKNYDGGLIMISAKIHNPEMLELGYNFKTYIHEGTGHYWKESIKHPATYATWIVMDTTSPDDQVTKYLEKSKELKDNFNLVYDKNGMEVYKIKTHPEIIIK